MSTDPNLLIAAKNILIVEDNRDLAELLRLHLQTQGYEVDVAFDGVTGLRKVTSTMYSLVILDLMLPGMDGITLCQRLRESNAISAVLMLTSRTAEADRIQGLEVGADDYVLKPFSILELMARIKAMFRRMQVQAHKQPSLENQSSGHVIDHHNMLIDLTKRQVMISEKRIDLTAKEFDLLAYFAMHPGQVFSRKQLLDQVWGYAYEGYEHTVNSHINRLRVKIEANPTSPEYIETVWGVGYRYVD